MAVALVDHPAGSSRLVLRLAACRPSASGTGVSLTAAQLRINQRISQAAIRRLNVLTARVDLLPPPEPNEGGAGGSVSVSERQLLINQRIAQAAVRRANTLAGRLEGRQPPLTPEGARSGSENVTVSARQLLINQRIAQAAVRRANALAERIPAIPFPLPGRLSPEWDEVIGDLRGDKNVARIDTIRRRGTLGDGSPLAIGDSIPVVIPGYVRRALTPSAEPNARIGASGVIYKGVMFGIYLSIVSL
jgi:hypothetical protein